MSADTALFELIFGLSHRWQLFDAGAIFFAKYAIFFLGVFALLVVFRKKKLWLLLSSLAGCYALNFIIGKLWFRDRPFVVLHITPLIHHAATKAFPSDHTTVSFALATIIALIDRRFAFWAYILAFLIGIARISVGVHYPIDVIGGIIVGVSVPVIILLLYRALVRKDA